MMTVLNLLAIPLFALDSADATKTKTRSGATALSALTNRVPGRPIIETFGMKTPKITPIIIPIIIFSIRLLSVHFFYKFFHIFNSFFSLDNICFILNIKFS